MHIHERWFGMSIAIASWKSTKPKGAGWLYAGYSRALRAIKFGGCSGCPLCRMKQTYTVNGKKTSLQPLALAAWKDWRLMEAKLLHVLGKPKFGQEWFEPEQRLAFAVSIGWVHLLPFKDRELSTMIAIGAESTLVVNEMIHEGLD